MAKTKTSVTKSAIPVGTEDAPVEDQAKVTKKKGRPAKTKPAIEEPIQEDVSELAAVEQLTQEEVDEEGGGATAAKKNSKPGTRSKQKQAGLVFPIIRMRQYLKKGKITQDYLAVDCSDILLSRQLPAVQPQGRQVDHSHLPGWSAGIPHSRGPGARWGRRQGREEGQDRSQAHHAGRPQ